MTKKKIPETPQFTLRFRAADVKDIPSALRQIADEVPEDIGPVGTWGGRPDSRRWLLIHGDGKQR